MTKRHVWLCGTYIRDYAKGRAWELNGIFTSKKKALARCKTPKDFVAKIATDVPFPERTHEMPICEYPLAPKGE
jgi:hypothetical protein